MCEGTDKYNTEQVNHLLHVHSDEAGVQWVAVYGPPTACFSNVVATFTPVFGSGKADILIAGNHEWHWHPCML